MSCNLIKPVISCEIFDLGLKCPRGLDKVCGNKNNVINNQPYSEFASA